MDVKAVLERHQRKLAVALLLLSGIGLGAAVDHMVAASIWRGMPAAPAPEVDRQEQTETISAPFEQYSVILERNLFRTDVERAETEPEAVTAPAEQTQAVEVEKKLEKSPLPAEVIGTLAGPDAYSVALIRDKRNKEVELYWVGDKLFNQATILKINRGEVIVLRGNKQEVLQLFEDEGGEITTEPPPPESEPEPEPEPEPSGDGDGELIIDQVGEGDYVIDKDSFDSMLQNLGPLLTQARVVPNFSKGKIDGYKIFAIKDGSVFETIGLQNGDIIQSVNGVGIDTPEKALQLFQRLRSETSFDIAVEREGSRQQMSYSLQ